MDFYFCKNVKFQRFFYFRVTQAKTLTERNYSTYFLIGEICKYENTLLNENSIV